MPCLWRTEEVDGCLRGNVMKSNAEVIFIDQIRRDLFTDQLVKKCGCQGIDGGISGLGLFSS